MKLYLQTITENFQLNNLPEEWLNIDLAKFSNNKALFDYQQNALKNAIKALYKYFIECKQNKEEFFKLYINNGLTENLDIKLSNNKNYKIFEEFDNHYIIQNNEIRFYHFINRMSFWMATGSGKTLVIVKLIELLAYLIQQEQIPKNDILFLTYREDLIEQFRYHVDEFNSSNNSFYINLYNLKDYEKIKRDNLLKFSKEIDVFYYRSDLISDEQKDKIINFRNYDNFGKWYILLDEAHKGDKEDSKRQNYYSILSRNGFLFNFSATFTDDSDFATCVYNFNLEQFITKGYGKHIYISQSDITSLTQIDEFIETQKQIIILKILLLHTIIKKYKQSINENLYHKPLILSLVNSVNTEDSDLELFFKEIEKIAQGNAQQNLLNIAKDELKKDLQGKCEFDNEKIVIDNSKIDNIHFSDILQHTFNAQTNGKIEVLKIPGNKQELILKLTTSDSPFALIKIGDISEWIKNKLTGYEIIEKFDNESVFKQINSDDSDINILMGSRAFYEGWDSNRPNIILYINIGKGTDAKKFVLQSIGRGVRIEPLPNKRKRLLFLVNNNEFDKNIFNAIKDMIQPLETLFVYGTKAENLKEVIETLQQEKHEEEWIGDLFEINPEIKDKLLLIPTYQKSNKILADENDIIKFEVHPNDLDITKTYFNYIGDKIALMHYQCQPKLLQKVSTSFDDTTTYYLCDKSFNPITKPELLLNKIFKHFSQHTEEFKDFKELENEIIHFKQIRLTKNQKEKIEEKINQVLRYKEKEKKIEEVAEKIKQAPSKIIDYTKEIEKITQTYVKETEIDYGNNSKIKIKYLSNHYYLPVALSEDEKENYLMHIIKTKSEVKFINDLEKYLESDNHFFKQFDWWFFSKIDETLDEVYIPYYQPKANRIERFKPDFIFWLKKGKNYTILFVDPKGTEHADGYRKIDGYSRIFEMGEQKQSRDFSYNDFTINVKLLLKPANGGIASVPEPQRRYWFDNFNDFAEKIKNPRPPLTEKTR